MPLILAEAGRSLWIRDQPGLQEPVLRQASQQHRENLSRKQQQQQQQQQKIRTCMGWNFLLVFKIFWVSWLHMFSYERKCDCHIRPSLSNEQHYWGLRTFRFPRVQLILVNTSLILHPLILCGSFAISLLYSVTFLPHDIAMLRLCPLCPLKNAQKWGCSHGVSSWPGQIRTSAEIKGFLMAVVSVGASGMFRTVLSPPRAASLLVLQLLWLWCWLLRLPWSCRDREQHGQWENTRNLDVVTTVQLVALQATLRTISSPKLNVLTSL